MSGNLTERWFTVNGLELLVEDRGAGPVIVLAHGMWCDASMFQAVAEDLARDHRVLVPEFRGHGRSAVPASPWTIADLADDLRRLFDALEVPRAVLAGFSMGGMTAAEFALAHPERLTGLALIGTSVAAEELLRQAEIRALAKLVQLAGVPRFLPQESARATFSPEFRKRHPELVARWTHGVAAMGRPALIHALRAVGSRRALLERLDEVHLPTLIVTGTLDRVLAPRWSRAMRRRLPQARLVAFPGVGHAVPLERPHELATLLRALAQGRLPDSG